MSTSPPHDTFVAFPTELGWMAFAKSAKGIRRLTFGYPTEEAAIAALGPVGVSDATDDKQLEALVRRLQAYACGCPDEFHDVAVDSGRQTAFRTRVYRLCRKISFGKTLTYGELAARAGSPGAARAVGCTMAANPVPLIVPCHRVVPSGGGLGGFSGPGGVALKRRLLDLEAGHSVGCCAIGLEFRQRFRQNRA